MQFVLLFNLLLHVIDPDLLLLFNIVMQCILYLFYFNSLRNLNECFYLLILSLYKSDEKVQVLMKLNLSIHMMNQWLPCEYWKDLMKDPYHQIYVL
jgi:hypothetical protein